MKNRLVCFLALVGVLGGSGLAAEEGPTIESKLGIAEALRASVAQVEFTLKFDKGEPPRGSGWAERCPNCGSYHGTDLEDPVREERPHESPGFVLSPTEVLAPDPLMHSRFIKGVAVRFGDQLVEATPAAYALNQNAMILKLTEPLKGAEPLKFDVSKGSPYLTVTYSQINGAWTIDVRPLSIAVAATETGRKFLSVPSYCLIVDSEGAAVGMSMKDELPVDDSWKGSPLKWSFISSEEITESLKKLEERFNRGVLRVRLSFRSPKKTSRFGYSRYDRDEDTPTERYVLGRLIGKKRLLVLGSLKPKVTGRLERIVVYPPEGDSMTAKFAQTLKDYGAFIATLEKPLPGALEVFPDDVMSLRNKLLLSAEVKLQGEKRTTYFWHSRIASFDIGWKRRIFPDIRGPDEGLLLFDTEGRLVAFPIAHREKVSVERGWRDGRPRLTPGVHLAGVLADPAKHSDPSNVPLTEEEENRLAWLGAELQPLNKELARINKVSHLTKDGEIGTLVSCVYPDSPADKADVRVGDILIRLHVEDHPKPIDVTIEESRFRGQPFPWDQLDKVAEQYFDQIPRPWPAAENSFTRALTDLGFGKRFVAELFREGETLRKEFAVVESPPHYDSAGKYKSKALGVTVRNLTYEVQRYFQKAPNDPGVVVSKVEPGGKGSVSGIKPYEIITLVNDEPVMNVKNFEKLIAGQAELRLSVKRMTKGRVVKIKMKPPPTTKPTSEE